VLGKGTIRPFPTTSPQPLHSPSISFTMRFAASTVVVLFAVAANAQLCT
jgi:hypothetical protein